MSDKMREEFEEWLISIYPNQEVTRYSDGDYTSFSTGYCWAAWQASRAALVVELPGLMTFGIQAQGYYRAVQDCREAIEAAGVKVKP